MWGNRSTQTVANHDVKIAVTPRIEKHLPYMVGGGGCGRGARRRGPQGMIMTGSESDQPKNMGTRSNKIRVRWCPKRGTCMEPRTHVINEKCCRSQSQDQEWA